VRGRTALGTGARVGCRRGRIPTGETKVVSYTHMTRAFAGVVCSTLFLVACGSTSSQSSNLTATPSSTVFKVTFPPTVGNLAQVSNSAAANSILQRYQKLSAPGITTAVAVYGATPASVDVIVIVQAIPPELEQRVAASNHSKNPRWVATRLCDGDYTAGQSI
jgi:hypothetical protein